MLGVNATLGRTITPGDDRVPDGHPVAMLSYSFWRSYFHADRSILVRTISLNGYSMTVIGVARPGFDGVELGNPAKVFVPIMMKVEMAPYWDGRYQRPAAAVQVTYCLWAPEAGRERAAGAGVAATAPARHS